MTQSDDSQTWSVVHQHKVMCKISAQYVKVCRRKVRKTGGRTETRTDGWTESRTDRDPDGHHHTIIRPVWRRAYKKLYVSCGKLHITYILSSQRGITLSNIDAKCRQSNLICSTSTQSHVQNFSSICQSM